MDLGSLAEHDIDLVVARILVGEETRPALERALERSFDLSDGSTTLLPAGHDEPRLFSLHNTCPGCGRAFEELDPRLFSFNSKYGQCTECKGTGLVEELDPELMVADTRQSLEDGGLEIFRRAPIRRALDAGQVFYEAREAGIPTNVPIAELRESQWNRFFHAQGDFVGLIPRVSRLQRRTSRKTLHKHIEAFLAMHDCPDCDGKRLRDVALAVRVDDTPINTVSDMTVDEALTHFTEMKLRGRDAALGDRVVEEIAAKLRFLQEVGLGYLSLGQPLSTLSGGEHQRLRLGQALVEGAEGALYVFDEPTTGLHPADIAVLLECLDEVVEAGASVLRETWPPKRRN